MPRVAVPTLIVFSLNTYFAAQESTARHNLYGSEDPVPCVEEFLTFAGDSCFRRNYPTAVS